MVELELTIADPEGAKWTLVQLDHLYRGGSHDFKKLNQNVCSAKEKRVFEDFASE
jgi:hypothetical protein